MKYKCPMLVVEDMERSKTFYREVMGLRVTMDLGANVTMTGGMALQTKDSWGEFICRDSQDIIFGGNDGELYFEESNFDEFVEKLKQFPDVQLVHPVLEHRWGQRVVRLYDPDRHIVEVGEEIKSVCRRFLDSGLTVEETAARMDLPVKFVKANTQR